MKHASRWFGALAAALLITAWTMGWLAALGDPEAIRARVAAAGALGPLVYVGLATVLSLAFLYAPAVWASAALWPLPLAFGYSIVAAVLASVLAYAAFFRLRGDSAEDRVPASIKRWEERLRAQPLSTIIALRLLLGANPMVDLFSVATRIPTRTYLLATGVGLIPPTIFHVVVGAGALTVAAELRWWGWILIALTAAALGVAVHATRRCATRAAL
jgi:uncharacterized membrane protein YdjX (TVP38/TMEM64 family)